VHGALVSGGTVDAPIGRHPKDRKRMAVVDAGKEAVTHYRLSKRLRDFSALDVSLETGRTHQIRVHMMHIRHPVVGDPVYGSRFRPPAGAEQELLDGLLAFRRQALHARQLTFLHPASGESVTYQAPIPADMVQLMELLDNDPSQNG
jgi:23S rRNA pseudouridine1911/1915/1917 synthase